MDRDLSILMVKFLKQYFKDRNYFVDTEVKKRYHHYYIYLMIRTDLISKNKDKINLPNHMSISYKTIKKTLSDVFNVSVDNLCCNIRHNFRKSI